MGRPPASAGAAAAAVEDRQLDARVACDLCERLLGAVDRPLGGEVAAVLAGVGVAHHHLEPVPALGDPGAVTLVGEKLAPGRVGRLEVGVGLEERHDGDGLGGEVEHAEDVGCARGRGDDHRVERAVAVPGARGRDRLEDVPRAVGRRAHLARVEAHVELRHVEPEQRHAALQRGERPVGHAFAAIRLEAAPDHREIGGECLRGVVPVVLEPPPDVGELLAVALRRHHPDPVVAVAAAFLDVARDRLCELVRDVDERAARREGDRKGADVVAVPGEHGLAGALERREDGVPADRRVPVEVAADPGSERERRRAARLIAAVLVQEALARVVQALLDEPEAVPDLIADTRPVVPYLVGLPEDRDLLRELLLELEALGRRQVGVVHAREQPCNPDVSPEQRPPRRLGRVGREDELQRGLAETVLELPRRDGLELVERLGERLAWGPVLSGNLAAAADPVVLLCRVRELEVEAEGPEHPLLHLRRELVDRFADVGGGALLSRAARACPHALLGGEEVLALLLDQHAPE